MLTPIRTSELCDGFVFDLPYPFSGKMKPFANILKTQRMVYTYPKEITDHIFLPFGKCAEAAFYFHSE